ncbi:MAG: CmcI family methyltransferase, partial [Pseudomonadota bacterium]
MVTPGSFLVIADTVLGHFDEAETPKQRSQVLYRGDEPLAARDAYLAETDAFEVDATLNGKLIMASSPGGYLLRR